MIIQENHQVEAQTTKAKSFLTKKIDFSRTKAEPKRRQMNVYAKKSAVLNHAQEKNVKIRHKFLTLKSYVFESIQRIDFNLFSCLFEIHAVVSDDCDAVSMANFGKSLVKIYSNQFFERFRYFETFRSLFTNIAFNYESVFFEKSVKSDELINFFEIQVSKKDATLTPDVSKH